MSDRAAASRTSLVFLPGLPSGALDQSAEGLARRLCHALNLRARERQPTFELGTPRVLSYGGVCRAEVQPILRREGDESVSGVLDVVVLPYFPALTRGFNARPTWQKMLRLLAAMLGALPAIGRALISSRRAKALPIITAGGVFGLLGLYFLLLSLTVVITLLSALPSLSETIDAPALAHLHLSSFVPPWLLANAATLLATMTAAQALIGNLVPDAKRAAFADAATAYLSMIEYMNGAAERAEVTSHLQSFLESLHDDNTGYGEVHVIGYSFGAVVALDSLFPAGTSSYAPPPVMRTVKTLSTIGCPFDVFSAFWPNHFRGRVSLPDAPESWINVTIDSDPLGSSFDDVGIALATQGMRRPDDLVEGAEWGQVAVAGLSALLFQLGQLRFHSQYWYESVQARACFDPLVTRLLARHPVLLGSELTAAAAE
jgi:hypothetical protein